MRMCECNLKKSKFGGILKKEGNLKKFEFKLKNVIVEFEFV